MNVSHPKIGEMSCRFRSEANPDYRCPTPVLADSDGYCVFHHSDEKDPGSFQEKLLEQLEAENFDFTGYIFPEEFDWGDRTFEREVRFVEAQFLTGACFDEIRFLRDVSFEGARFTGEEVSFWGARFAGERTIFLGARFETERVSFEFARFSGREVRFDGAEFLSEEVNFEAAVFARGRVSFAGTRFSGVTSFEDVEFNGRRALFDGTVFSGEFTRFKSAHFEAETVFRYTQFSREAYFDQIHGADLTLSQVRFSGAVSFAGAELDRATFRDVDLRNVSFRGVQLRDVHFINVVWNQAIYRWAGPLRELFARPICRDERDANDLESYARAEDVCRQIKRVYQNAGNYQQAGEFHYGEMECARRTRRWLSKNLGPYQLYRLVIGYGERPLRVILTSALIILVFALPYWGSGDLFTITQNNVLQTADLFDTVYFSVVTFTTLGLGDFQPTATSWVRAIVMIEAFLGAFMMALFVLTFGRKMIR
ncbi:MAG: pentapeptide repeat-containing protein [Candidatus Bipolaricaulia bacterium]